MPSVQSKRWVFTLNNYTPAEMMELKEATLETFSYLLFGEEIGDEGTPHLQGYFELPKKRSPGGLAVSLPGLSRARLAIARGSAKENRVYCGKDSNPYVLGNPMQQGRRTDLKIVKRAIDEGLTQEQLWDKHFSTMVHNHRALLVYKRFKSAKRDWLPNIILFVGPTGTGKSRTAHNLASKLGTSYTVPMSKGSGLYFDGYDEHEVVIIDEMDGNRCTPTFLNSLTDRYEMSVPVHGSGNTGFLAKTIIICSNYVPKTWWKNHNISSFERRVTWRQYFGYLPASVADQFLNGISNVSGYYE